MGAERVHFFGKEGDIEGAPSAARLGSKGASLATLGSLGLPVAPGFVLSTDTLSAVREAGWRMPDSLREELEAAIAELESRTGRGFGKAEAPLLLSVRVSPSVPMPRLASAALDVGLDATTLDGLSAERDARTAWDCRRRMSASFGELLLGDGEPFEQLLSDTKIQNRVDTDAELSEDALRELSEAFDALILERTGRQLPSDPWGQLTTAIVHALKSWSRPKAAEHRRRQGIPDEVGMALVVQAMALGTQDDRSGIGICFNREPSTGDKRFFGEWLPRAQGEVLAGPRQPLPLLGDRAETLETQMPELLAALREAKDRAEEAFRDMVELDWVAERGVLALVGARVGAPTPEAAIRVAVDLAKEGRINRREAVLRVRPEHIEQLIHPMLDPEAARSVVARGLAASPGVATGAMVLTAAEAEERGKRGEEVILVRNETALEDVAGMRHAVAVLTIRGGLTSHAAVVARGIGLPCIVGCTELAIDLAGRAVTLGGRRFDAGTTVTLDGSSGEIMIGSVVKVHGGGSQAFDELMGWADEVRRLRVRANADTPADAVVAKKFGAEGVGLCRTEHMFSSSERINVMREMVLAESETGRRAALARLEPMQVADFREIFEAMAGQPVTVRLFDPPLHELLPSGEEQLASVAAALGRGVEVIRNKVEALTELNPMLGLRGSRLGLAFPEIYQMQTRAVIKAALAVKREGLQVFPEIMIPLVAGAEELKKVREMLAKTVELSLEGATLEVKIGTMIETPRAALTAGLMAEHADFFSFGTNDLTQLTLGMSRDDAAAFLPAYVRDGLFAADPFEVLDFAGVGRLLEFAVSEGRAARGQLKIGVCGEHGGESRSVRFCHEKGLDYVSCSPFRVPVARLAAAHAALEETS